MSTNINDLPPDEQEKVRTMITKPMTDERIKAKRDALQDSLRAEVDKAKQSASIRSALNGATEWLRFVSNEHGRELSDFELSGVRSKLVECEAALRRSVSEDEAGKLRAVLRRVVKWNKSLAKDPEIKALIG